MVKRLERKWEGNRARINMPTDKAKSQCHNQSRNQLGWGRVNLASKGTYAEVLKKQSIVEEQMNTRI